MVLAEKFTFSNLIDYTENGIISKQIIKLNSGSITLFAFDEGQALSEHTAPYDALVQVVEGKADITIDQEVVTVEAGESVILPANVPHAVKAPTSFKMILTMIRECKQ